ncbi:hypothetical protein BGW38_002765 [Lunasporangiospora selenospora]|uniref:Uncharacterized protein n=1 Tax=Lunasporangiospora selenospora TaxID=979761 RepID=A0A9P6G3A6_9FUNG|nr:hypothetical protein BGW38_002765 [Lunasporangiospora selenospora]
MVGVFLASLAEYLTLFFPKMRNLWLQKHGLNVRAGREEDTIESLGGGPEGISKRGVLSKNKEYTREQRRLAETFNDSPFNFGSTGEAAPSGDKNLNISDLVSSYPFGQLGSDPNVPPIGSPPQRTCLYSQPNPMKRGIRHPHDPEDVQSEGQDTATNSQPGLFQAHSGGVADSPASGSKDCRTTPKAGLFIINPTGLNVFTQDNRLSSMRSSQDAQSYGLHEILMASPNQSRGVENPSDFRAGKMSETPECTGSRHGGMGPPQPRTGHDQGAMLDPYLRSGSSSASRFAGMDFSDIDPFSRKSSVGDMDFTSSGQTRAWKSNKSPRICPFPGAQSSLTSGMHPQRAIKITVPVQRQRWYILRVLAQWRMSKVVFVPYSKVLVIIDLETERAESLILHSIEPGYWSQEEEEARIAMRRSSTISALSRDGLLDLSCSRAENISGDTVAPTILEARGDAGTGSQGHPLAAPPVVRTPSPLLGVQPRYTSPLDRPYRPRSQHASDRSHIEGGPTAHLGRSSNPNPPIEEMIDRGRSASLPLTRIDVVATSARTSTDAGPARRGILRRMSDYKVLKNVRSRISIPFFADFSARNMDGIRAREDGTSVIEEGVGNSKSVAASFIEDADDNGSEGGDFIVRVISIHHECWRVQLPDRETMERWIEVGQMIKDENWISARPLTLNHSYQSGNGNATVGPWSRGRFGSFSSTAVLGGGSGSGAGTVGDDDTRPRSLRNERGSPFQRHNQGEASAAGMTTSMPVDITAPYPKRPLKDRVVLDNMERKGTSDYRHTRDIGGATKPSSVPEASEESGKVRRGSSQLLRPSNQDRIDSNATSVSETFGGSGLQSLHHRHDRRRSSGDISGSICSINNGNTNSSIDSITSFDSSSAGDSSREIPYKMALPLLPSTLQEVTHALAPFDTLHPLETSVSTRLGKTPLIRLSQTYTDDIEVNSSVLGTKSFHASNYPAFGDGTASEIDQRLENDQDHSSSWAKYYLSTESSI